MHCFIGVTSQVYGIDQGLIGEEGAGFNGAADASVFLIDHPAGTQIEVADFRVTHLAGGQPNFGTGATDKGVWVFSPEFIPDWFFGSHDGIAIAFFGITPSVEDD